MNSYKANSANTATAKVMALVISLAISAATFTIGGSIGAKDVAVARTAISSQA